MTIQRASIRGDNKLYVVLVLQGGGALGAYQIGAYQAMEEAGYRPDWVSGISIGAVNSAIIAGNPPGDRVERLEELWNAISRPDGWGALLTGEFREWFNRASIAEAILFGQPNFFRPRISSPYFAPPGTPEAVSFYNDSPLRDTLERFADFDLINAGAVRLSLGVTKVRTGELEFFDNTRQKIGPEHVMASGSLPPAFPGTPIAGELYWDGGCVSNTPLEAVIQDEPKMDTLVFMIDLWSKVGAEPRSIDEVLWRQKQIQYASRTDYTIKSIALRVNQRYRLRVELDRKLSDLSLDSLESRSLTAVRATLGFESRKMHIAHIIYEPGPDQLPMSDVEFSRPSIADRRAAGYHDMEFALKEAPWFKEEVTRAMEEPAGAYIHQFKRGQCRTLIPTEPSPESSP
jgi:NTE family protein